ncbi:MAG: hypothetical protein Q9162_004182 [Coniocarpon cinnabarinum]
MSCASSDEEDDDVSPASAPPYVRYTKPLPDRGAAPSPFRVDEGYSEAPQQPDSDSENGNSSGHVPRSRESAARQWLLSQPVDLRILITRELMHSLPTSNVAELVREANHRLHFDPVACLPQEIISSIFDYLQPKSLCIAALASRAWKHRAHDPRLWRRLFLREGWACNIREMQGLENLARAYKRRTLAETISILEHLCAHQQRASVRHMSVQSLGDNEGTLDLPDMLLDIGVPTASLPRPPFSGDTEMQDVSGVPVGNTLLTANRPLTVPRFAKLLTMDPIFDHPTLNWQYLYTQRRRLERNWYAGKFINFRLPHIDFPEETHTQCVYTVQFSGNHLVSGSRDKSVRVWDLRTQRLRLPPLEGHTGSVLCLQFDERPEQDIIVSGGSDADVIIWRFSDGALLKRMTGAHTESVLNLRFDETYLVTCSKDKTIKVWNRKTLSPADPNYPQRNDGRDAHYPTHIVDTSKLSLTAEVSAEALEPFSHLMTFDGHGAAVNALQIRGYEIVSASGDRKVMLWNIKTGELVRTFSGHSKGIACIQYDGRRIVSGSSDNSVRIFDVSTAAEVSLLDGHRNLVRTVQAEFGDFQLEDADLEAQARASDKEIAEVKAQQMDVDKTEKSETEPNQNRSKPYVMGAKLPPGGGGTHWSKIVSGSYDETLIIWRRDKSGRWYIAKELRQEEALRNSARRTPLHLDAHRRQAGEELLSIAAQPQASTLRHQLQQNQWQMLQLQQQHRQALLDSLGPQSRQQGVQANAAARSEAATATTTPAAAATAAAAATQPSLPPAPPVPAPEVPTAPTAQHPHPHHPPRPPGAQPQATAVNPQTQATLQQAWQNAMNRPARPHHHHPHAHHHHHPMQAAAAQVPSLNNRVFKLQFDARRIVCCSQEPVIVGWDFANGDRELEDVCGYFGDPR